MYISQRYGGTENPQITMTRRQHPASQTTQGVPMQTRTLARHVIAVASGKGGVGKSSITLNAAALLAQQGARVGLVDCDVYGPDIPAMIGLTRRVMTRQWTLSRKGGFGSTKIDPIERFGVHIVSPGLLFGEEQALSWPAGMITVLVHQLLWSSVWPELDYLIMDMPPGTADVTQAVFQSIPKAKAVIVVTPQEVAHLDARKLVTFLSAYGTEVLGGIENMAGFRCPCCETTTQMFAPVNPQRSIWSSAVDRLGAIPLDPAPPGDDPGIPIVVSRPTSAFAVALHGIVAGIRHRIGDT
jgi:ATP-binding protein involved in chromosome partitioning